MSPPPHSLSTGPSSKANKATWLPSEETGDSTRVRAIGRSRSAGRISRAPWSSTEAALAITGLRRTQVTCKSPHLSLSVLAVRVRSQNARWAGSNQHVKRRPAKVVLPLMLRLVAFCHETMRDSDVQDAGAMYSPGRTGTGRRCWKQVRERDQVHVQVPL